MPWHEWALIVMLVIGAGAFVWWVSGLDFWR